MSAGRSPAFMHGVRSTSETATAFAHRSCLYAALHADYRISKRTTFFAAASIVTNLFSHCTPSPFFSELSGSLEKANLRRAEQIRIGALYPSGSVERNTADFVHYEQTMVQIALDQLRITCPDRYRREVRVANGLLRPMWVCAAASLVQPLFARALLSVTRGLGRSVNVEEQRNRELLGMEIAKLCGRQGGREIPGASHL
jgi:hypothetical protein